jgi:hypothetical protein
MENILVAKIGLKDAPKPNKTRVSWALGPECVFLIKA